MALLDDVHKHARRGGTRCTVAIALEGMTPKLRAETHAAMGLPLEEAPHAAICRALKARGHHVSQHAMGRHRRKDCSCDHG